MAQWDFLENLIHFSEPLWICSLSTFMYLFPRLGSPFYVFCWLCGFLLCFPSHFLMSFERSYDDFHIHNNVSTNLKVIVLAHMRGKLCKIAYLGFWRRQDEHESTESRDGPTSSFTVSSSDIRTKFNNNFISHFILQLRLKADGDNRIDYNEYLYFPISILGDRFCWVDRKSFVNCERKFPEISTFHLNTMTEWRTRNSQGFYFGILAILLIIHTRISCRKIETIRVSAFQKKQQ